MTEPARDWQLDLRYVTEKWQQELQGYLSGMMMESPVGEMNRASAHIVRVMLKDLEGLRLAEPVAAPVAKPSDEAADGGCLPACGLMCDILNGECDHPCVLPNLHNGRHECREHWRWRSDPVAVAGPQDAAKDLALAKLSNENQQLREEIQRLRGLLLAQMG